MSKSITLDQSSTQSEALGPQHEGAQTSREPISIELSNGSYTVDFGPDGHSRSCWKDIDVTRWRSDRHTQGGFRIFVRDCDTGEVWRLRPNLGRGSDLGPISITDCTHRYEVDLAGISVVVDIRIEDEIDAEVHSVSLHNESGMPRRLEITSYVELALASHGSDLGHPAFSKLFVETNLYREGLLVAHRRPRTATEGGLWAAHLLVASKIEQFAPPVYETSRNQFIGRQGKTNEPKGLYSALTCSTGSVLDPIFAHRVSIVLQDGIQRSIYFALAASSSEKQILSDVDTLQNKLSRELDQTSNHCPSAHREDLEPIVLVDKNGFGGFSANGDEYVIELAAGKYTPAPWINVIANSGFGMTVSESGSGCVWAGNSQQNRLTPWSNDPVCDPPGDVIYLRDEDNGEFWSVTARPIRDNRLYRARHGQGYSIFEHNCRDIDQELTVFVPNTDGIGHPVKVQRLKITNRSQNKKKLSATAYVEWVLGFDREISSSHITTSYDVKSRSIQAVNRHRGMYGNRTAFLSSSITPSDYSADRSAFLGDGSIGSPTGMQVCALNNSVGKLKDPCGALRVLIDLLPGETKELVFLLGEALTTAEVERLCDCFSDVSFVDTALAQTRRWWDRTLGTIKVKTPDGSLDRLLNRWLLYQDLSCRIWGRTAFYQSGGAFGFRDQLQDMMALVYTSPDLVREHIVRASARQYEQGDVQHWWHPDTGIGVRTRISDDLIWLPYVTAHYVRVTGDYELLQETAPFISSPTLDSQEHERVEAPAITREAATIIDHCLLAVKKGATCGAHGLPLIGGGDWNDGFNKVGEQGRGESVWLAWFLIHTLKDVAEMLVLCGRFKEAQSLIDLAERYRLSIEEHCWDGDWYVRAFYDDGSPLGSKDSDEAKIDSLAQSWAAISGAGDVIRTKQALESAAHRLVNERAGCVMLFAPPFDKSKHDPGYIKGYVPGVRENGGQYTHGSLWLPMAFARIGDGDSAARLLDLMNPVNHSKTEADAQQYCVEPYVVAADIYSEASLAGRGGWTWYTGSAGWMYRIWIEEVLGFHKRGTTLEIAPVIPQTWPGYSIDYLFGAANYHVDVENVDLHYDGVKWLEVDGIRLAGNSLELVDDRADHRILVVLG